MRASGQPSSAGEKMEQFDTGHRRFFVEPSQVSEGRITIEGQDARQITTVLRLKPGECVTVLDGTGAAYAAKITSAGKSSVVAEVIGVEYPDTEPRTHVTLAQALPKGCKLELIVQKACELGISEVVGLVTERTICRPAKEKFPERVERWQRIAKEAAEQCARAKIPVVRGILALEEFLSEIPHFDLALVAHEDEETLLLSDALKERSDPKRILLTVGPEGGFTGDEVDRMVHAGAKAVSLGKRVLRAETASIAACAIVINTLDGHL